MNHSDFLTHTLPLYLALPFLQTCTRNEELAREQPSVALLHTARSIDNAYYILSNKKWNLRCSA